MHRPSSRASRPHRAEAVVSGHRVAYQVAGSGPPVVLVHGLAGSLRWWCRNVAALAEAHTVYLLNLPGFGVFQPRVWGIGAIRPGWPRFGLVRDAGYRFSLNEAADW